MIRLVAIYLSSVSAATRVARFASGGYIYPRRSARALSHKHDSLLLWNALAPKCTRSQTVPLHKRAHEYIRDIQTRCSLTRV